MAIKTHGYCSILSHPLGETDRGKKHFSRNKAEIIKIDGYNISLLQDTPLALYIQVFEQFELSFYLHTVSC